MKTTILYITIIALLVALAFTVFNGQSKQSEDTTTVTPASNQAIQNIMSRASVRSFTDRKVSPETIDTLLRAAMAAPTARNSQPWHFVVVDKRDLLDTIASRLPNVHSSFPAPLAVVVCGNTDLMLAGDGQPFWVQDCSAATENLLLAAHALNLGAVWCGIYPSSEREGTLRDILSLPDNLVPLNVVVVGYPAGDVVPKDKFDASKISYE